MRGANVAILGFTFKESCPDTRNTRVFDIVSELREYGIEPTVADPVADADEARTLYGMKFTDLDAIRNMDAVVPAVAHDEFRNLDVAPLFGDGTRVLLDIKRMLDREACEAEGYAYWRL